VVDVVAVGVEVVGDEDVGVVVIDVVGGVAVVGVVV